MKTRVIVGVGLLAALVTTFLLASARIAAEQQAVDEEAQYRLRMLSQSRDNMMMKRRELEHESLATMRDLDAREQQLKHELEELAAKRAALQRSLEQRRAALQAKIDETDRDIQALSANSVPRVSRIGTPYTDREKRNTVAEKLDQILNRLQAMETRLDRLERAVKSPQPGR